MRGDVGAELHVPFVFVAELRESLQFDRPVGADGRPGLDHALREADQLEALSRAGLEPDAPEPTGGDHLRGNHHADLVAGASPVAAADAADEGLIDLDRAVQEVPSGDDHRTAELVHPRPRGLIRAQPEHSAAPAPTRRSSET